MLGDDYVKFTFSNLVLKQIKSGYDYFTTTFYLT